MKIKKILYVIILTIAFIFLGIVKSDATLKLNELDFDVQINTDGSMQVTENWDIRISDTNTLFKTFEIDNSKYTNITDVTVKEIGNTNKIFTKINQEMYHVTKDCYYALTNSNGLFEIAWGVGLDDSSATKKYQISYRVNDVIAKYNDYSELYWQFIGEDFEIDADEIEGTITLPSKVQNIEDIRVWGHTEDLNGEIYATDLDKIEFTIDNYSSGNYVEVRSLIPNYIIGNTSRIYNRNILNSVLEEENRWAEEANARRQTQKNITYILLGITTIITLFFIYKIIKNIVKLIKMEKKFKPTTKIEYFRELPYNDATPAEALFILSNGSVKSFSSSFSSNILDLCLNKYITIEEVKNGEKVKKDVVKINILEKEDTNLKKDEKLALDFLKEVAGENKELTTKDITKYLNKHVSKIEKLDKELSNILEKYEQENGKYQKQKSEEMSKYTTACICYLMFVFFTFFFPPLAIILFINAIIVGIMSAKVNILTQKGIDEKEQWKAFKKYMEDFSLLNEKEIPALVLWEKYLVFATAFGISDKVLKQLKVVYPEIVNMDSAMYTYSYIHIMNSVNIGNCINSSVYSSVASSGGGSGGGFSGGGGGGRWPEAAVVDAKI